MNALHVARLTALIHGYPVAADGGEHLRGIPGNVVAEGDAKQRLSMVFLRRTRESGKISFKLDLNNHKLQQLMVKLCSVNYLQIKPSRTT